MKRSTFLHLSALGAAGMASPFLPGCTGKSYNKALGQPLFLSHILDAKTLQETGKAYLQHRPGESSTGKLSALLTDGSLITENTDVITVQSYFNNHTKQDFQTGNTVVVNGWILSVTEARQSAFYSLSQS